MGRNACPNNSYNINDYMLSISKGEIPGHSTIFKFGFNATVGTTEAVIWDAGGNYIFLDAAETLDIVSDDSQDTDGGNGAHDVIIYGLDNDFNEITEIINLNGLTPVTTVNSYIRTYRAHILNSGNPSPVGDGNLGTIKFTASTTATLQAQMEPENGQTLMCIYTVPAGKTAYVTGVSFGCGKGKEAVIKGKVRNGIGGAFSVKYQQLIFESIFYGTLIVPFKVTEKLDVVFTGQDITSGTVECAASFGVIVVDN